MGSIPCKLLYIRYNHQNKPTATVLQMEQLKKYTLQFYGKNESKNIDNGFHHREQDIEQS